MNNYNTSLKQLARTHRSNSTRAEVRLWCELLKNKQMMGYPFLRQRPIGKYIADFCCKELMLIIETDGISHTWETADAKDRHRTSELESMGYTVIRFRDNDVIHHLDVVKNTIEEWIERNRNDIPLPPSKGDLILITHPNKMKSNEHI